jgi:hypothetical protein
MRADRALGGAGLTALQSRTNDRRQAMTRIAAVAAPALLFLAGCATVIRGTEEEVSVNTNPIGANVEFSNGQNCTSPCRITAARDESLLVTISKENCGTQTATMVPTLGGAGVLLGGLIDYGTGAVYDLQPNPLTVTLMCTEVGVAPSPSGAAPVEGTTAAAPAAPHPAESAATSDDPRRAEIEAKWAARIDGIRGIYCRGAEGEGASECVDKVTLAGGARDAELQSLGSSGMPSEQN